MRNKTKLWGIALCILLAICIPNICNATTTEDLYVAEEELIEKGEFKYKKLSDTTVAVYGKHIIDVHKGGMSWNKNVNDIKESNIPSTVEINGKTYAVTAIGNNAFANCTNLTKISIPNTITIIGNSVFSDCKSLTRITIPNSAKIFGKSIFSNCTSLQEATINSNVIDEELFYNTKSLKKVTLSNNVVTIGKGAFANCENLTNINIPNSVTNLGDYAFNHTGITTITIPNSVTNVGQYAFGGCEKLTNITLSNKMTSIQNNTFAGCGMKTITIPSSITSIGNYAFGECKNLTTITIPNSVTNIGSYAFISSGVKNVTISNNITTINNYTFGGCNSLEKIVIPSSVKYVNDKAFYSCENLINVTIPKSAERIASTAFDNSNKVVVNTYKGSSAETYARTNAIPVVLLDDLTYPVQTNNTKVGYVTIAGKDVSLSGNEIQTNTDVYTEMKEKLQSKGYSDVFCAYELTATGKVDNGVELTFDVGVENNGKQAMILHKKSNGDYEEFLSVVENGQVKITVEEFSPFMVAFKSNNDNEIATSLDKNNNKKNQLDNEPETGEENLIIFASTILIISLAGIVILKLKK